MRDPDRFEQVMRVHAEGRAAAVGAANPYAGQSRVLATVWMHAYMQMLRDMVNNSLARQAYLRNQRRDSLRRTD